jgi:hypothetical protein
MLCPGGRGCEQRPSFPAPPRRGGGPAFAHTPRQFNRCPGGGERGAGRRGPKPKPARPPPFGWGGPGPGRSPSPAHPHHHWNPFPRGARNLQIRGFRLIPSRCGDLSVYYTTRIAPNRFPEGAHTQPGTPYILGPGPPGRPGLQPVFTQAGSRPRNAAQAPP